jgi:hypothetical protein
MKGNEKSSLLGKAMRVGERLVEMEGEAKRLAILRIATCV